MWFVKNLKCEPEMYEMYPLFFSMTKQNKKTMIPEKLLSKEPFQ
jgi:hypothetical protein